MITECEECGVKIQIEDKDDEPVCEWCRTIGEADEQLLGKWW